jgi:hypothetical protein
MLEVSRTDKLSQHPFQLCGSQWPISGSNSPPRKSFTITISPSKSPQRKQLPTKNLAATAATAFAESSSKAALPTGLSTFITVSNNSEEEIHHRASENGFQQLSSKGASQNQRMNYDSVQRMEPILDQGDSSNFKCWRAKSEKVTDLRTLYNGASIPLLIKKTPLATPIGGSVSSRYQVSLSFLILHRDELSTTVSSKSLLLY